MRKLVTKLLVALGLLTSGGAWAQTSGTVGITQTHDEIPTTDKKDIACKGTLAKPSTVEFGGITVAPPTTGTHLSLYNNRGYAAYLDGNPYCATDMWRTLKPEGSSISIATSFTERQAVDVKITVPVGKVLNISKIKAQLLTNDVDYNWKVAVIDEDGATLKETASNTSTKTGTTTPSINEDVSSNASLQGLTGTLVLRIYVYPDANVNRYFAIPYLTLDATLEESVQTQYNKPVITVGEYDVKTGKYSVTIEKTDDDGAIYYKVGEEGEYTAYSEALSVAPNTTITAKVTGDTYKDSEEASKTTDAMPTLATPTAAVAGYNFAANTYNITLAGPAGATIKYSTDNWATSGVYSGTIVMLPGATLKAKAEQTNMTTSAELSYAVAAAPVGGSDETPTTGETYTGNVSYSMAAITIPGGCIAGKNNSGTSSISGSIKTRTNQRLTAVSGADGFYVNVNPGYTVTSISIKTLSNKNGAITCNAVYVDSNPVNVLGTPVECPLASAADVPAAEIVVSDIAAKERIEFDFIQTEQAQMIITVTYECAGDITLNNVESLEYGFATLSAPNNFTVNNGTAYKATVSGSNLVLTEIGGVIPAGSGVVVVGEKGANVTVKYTAEEATADVAGNELKGTSVRTQTSELKGTATHLMMLHKTTSAFVSYTGEYFPANKAYVLVGGGANAVKSLSIVFGDEASATGINSVNVKETKVAEGTKHIINGQIVIKTQNGYMNLMGVKVK